MSYSIMLKKVKTERKIALECGMDQKYLALVDEYTSKAVYFRSRPECKQVLTNRLYSRAINYLEIALDIFDAAKGVHLQRKQTKLKEWM